MKKNCASSWLFTKKKKKKRKEKLLYSILTTSQYVIHSLGTVKAHDNGYSKAYRRQDECNSNFKVYEETENMPYCHQ